MFYGQNASSCDPLKQIVWYTQNWYYNFNSSSGSWVIDQNNILHILINNYRTSMAYWNFNAILKSSENFL